MKNFVVINGKEATVIKAENMDKAIEKCESICNFSREVIVREIDNLPSLIMHAHIIN